MAFVKKRTHNKIGIIVPNKRPQSSPILGRKIKLPCEPDSQIKKTKDAKVKKKKAATKYMFFFIVSYYII
jgi:hypothetical protein